MGTLVAISSSQFLNQRQVFSTGSKLNQGHLPHRKPRCFIVRAAAKLPPGVILPKVKPKLSEPFLGFTKTAEIWNSRACMIGLIGTIIVELIFHKGILEIIGVDVGKGLDIPL